MADRRDFMQRAIKRWHQSESADSVDRQRRQFDQSFYAGRQWSPRALKDRQQYNRPVLTINRTKEPVRQVVNDIRGSKPTMKVRPVDSGGDLATATIIQGMLRAIERLSSADIAYANSIHNAAVQGLGWIHVRREYTNPGVTLDQELRVVSPKNPFSVYFDPNFEQYDGSDGDFCFITNDMPEHEYAARFPGAEYKSVSGLVQMGNSPPQWVSGETIIRVAEYYFISWESVEMLVVQPRHTGAGELPKPIVVRADRYNDDGYEISRHEVPMRQLHSATINGAEILEGNDELDDGAEEYGSFLPIVPVIGERVQMIDNGFSRFHYIGLVSDVQDSQRLYNYATSQLAEKLLYSPGNPIYATKGQIGAYERDYEEAASKPVPFLYYEPDHDPETGALIPPPGRQAVDPGVGQAVAAVQQADADIKATSHVHDASLGQKGPQESAAAIGARKAQDQLSNSHFHAHLEVALRHVARICIQQMPYVYDSERIVQTVGEDESTLKAFSLMPGFQAMTPDAQKLVRGNLPAGIEGVFDFGSARYDVAITIGPGYETRRAEAANHALQLVQSYPQLMEHAGWIILRLFDFPFADILADQMKFMAARAGLLQPTDEEGRGYTPEVAGLIAQLTDQVETLTNEKAQLEQAAAIDQARQQATIEAATIKTQGELQKAEIEGRRHIIQTGMRNEAQRAQTLLSSEVKASLSQLDAAIKAALQDGKTDQASFLEQVRGEMDRLNIGYRASLEEGAAERDAARGNVTA